MRSLTLTESTAVAGGSAEAKLVAIAAAGLIGGLASANVAYYLSPLCTVGGTCAGAAVGIFAGIPFTPVGSIVLGIAGAGVGYLTGSTMCQLGSFMAGGAGAAFAAHTYLLQ